MKEMQCFHCLNLLALYFYCAVLLQCGGLFGWLASSLQSLLDSYESCETPVNPAEVYLVTCDCRIAVLETRGL